MKKVLLVCTVPALESYNIGIISAAFTNDNLDCYAFIFLDGKDKRSRAELITAYGLPDAKSNRVVFQSLASNKVIRILSANKYLNEVRSFSGKYGIRKIHFISQDVMLSGHLSKFKAFELYYTVHDFVAHPVKLNLFQRAKHYYLRIRKDRLLMCRIDHLLTNSFGQRDALKQHYPTKQISWHRMPSTVTNAIKYGNDVVPEIKELQSYVLFFGRIEVYKGVERLYRLFTDKPDLAKLTLVIAGKGEIYFERDRTKEKHILFINRHIKAEEVGDLFKKAKLLVLPYESATQSAVTSISYHFGKPVVAAAIEGLIDSVVHEKTGLLYSISESDDGLLSSILRMYSDGVLFKAIKANLEIGDSLYDAVQLGQELEMIY